MRIKSDVNSGWLTTNNHNQTIARRRAGGFLFAALLSSVVGLALPLSSVAGNPLDERTDVAEARSATADFHRFDAALEDGRFALEDRAHLSCIEDPGGAGAMGVQYVNLDLVLDGEIDVRQPEALLYDVSGQHPRLVGVRYIVFVADWQGATPPVLFGHEFYLVEAGNRFGVPAFYALNAWIWSHNPRGMFENWNPNINCS